MFVYLLWKGSGLIASPKRIETRSQRSSEVNDEVIVLRIAKLIRRGERETASLIYSKAVSGTAAEKSIQEDKIKRIVSHAYQLSNVANILDFITSELNEPRQISIWLDVLLENMKIDNHLASIEGLQLGRITQRFVSNLKALKLNEDYLELLDKKTKDALIEPTSRLVTEWVKSIQSGYDGPVITTAIEYPLTFDSVIQQLISEAVASKSKNESETSFFERSKRTIDFINRIPWLTTTIDALVQFNETMYTTNSNLKTMSEDIMLAYSVKKLATSVVKAELPLQYQNKLQEMINNVPVRVKNLVWNPYVFIYKTDEPTTGMAKFISSNRTNIFSSNKRLTQFNESDTAIESSSKWILEPVNFADQFRIQNKETGEYLYSDDGSSLEGFPNKRSVFTHKLDYSSDINSLGDRLVWVLTLVDQTVGDGFLIMNLHWKEYLDNQDTPLNQVYTWKNQSNPPDSARHWIISDRISHQKSDLKGKHLVCFFDSLATEREGMNNQIELKHPLCALVVVSF